MKSTRFDVTILMKWVQYRLYITPTFKDYLDKYLVINLVSVYNRMLH